MSDQAVIDQVRAYVEAEDYDGILRTVMDRFGAAVGTIHRLANTKVGAPDVGASGVLELVAQRGLPEVLLDTVARIPIGKGMAGLAAERREPVQVCNLQSDDSGVAKPGAKLTKMEGSIALPILQRGEVRGTFGIGKPVPHEYNAAEVALLESVSELLVLVV